MRIIYGLRLLGHCIHIPSKVVEFLPLFTKYCLNHIYGSKISFIAKDKDVGKVKIEKPKAHWTIANKKLFLNLVLEQKQKGNRPDKAFNAVGWENIVKEFNTKTDT